MLPQGRRYVIRRERAVRTIVVVFVANIEGHLEIINHHHSCWASVEHDAKLLGERKIGIPMRIEIEEEGGGCDGANRPHLESGRGAVGFRSWRLSPEDAGGVAVDLGEQVIDSVR